MEMLSIYINQWVEYCVRFGSDTSSWWTGFCLLCLHEIDLEISFRYSRCLLQFDVVSKT